MDTFFDIEAQERSRVTKLGAQTQHRVVLRLVPPSASKQSEIVCARDKCVVFHNIGKAISGSTVSKHESFDNNVTVPRKSLRCECTSASQLLYSSSCLCQHGLGSLEPNTHIILRSVDNENATEPFFLTLPFNSSH